jgi:hypothetical protein
MAFDPKALFDLARIGARQQLDVIKEHFPDLLPSRQQPAKPAATKPATDDNINPKTGLPYKWSPAARKRLAASMRKRARAKKRGTA